VDPAPVSVKNKEAKLLLTIQDADEPTDMCSLLVAFRKRNQEPYEEQAS
jgi:hypothetical protein